LVSSGPPGKARRVSPARRLARGSPRHSDLARPQFPEARLALLVMRPDGEKSCCSLLPVGPSGNCSMVGIRGDRARC